MQAKQADSTVGDTEGAPAVAVVMVPVTTAAATASTSEGGLDTPLRLPDKAREFEPTHR